MSARQWPTVPIIPERKLKIGRMKMKSALSPTRNAPGILQWTAHVNGLRRRLPAPSRSDQKNTFTSKLAVFWSVSKERVSLMPYLLLQ